MRVRELKAGGFRNLEPLSFTPDEGLNLICGENAQGKTNLLEAMWLFTGGRSFRGAKDAELVAVGSGQAELFLSFDSQERTQTAELTLRGGARRALLNGCLLYTSDAADEGLGAVIFSPEHLSLVKGGPAERRSFLDSALCQVRPAYAALYTRYRHTLDQRNALLKDISSHSELIDTLSSWDDRLCR